MQTARVAQESFVPGKRLPSWLIPENANHSTCHIKQLYKIGTYMRDDQNFRPTNNREVYWRPSCDTVLEAADSNMVLNALTRNTFWDPMCRSVPVG